MERQPAPASPQPELVSLGSAPTRDASSSRVEPPREALAAGSLLAGRYRLGRFLARGGAGEVYEAHDELLDAPVALKLLRLGLEADPARLRRFKRELFLARLVAHPNVCRVYDLEVDDATRRTLYFLTMELLSGVSLRERILERGRLTPAEALPLVSQMTSALGAAHAASIVHRDLKSSNVMLVAGECGERLVVTDFGLARGQHADAAEEQEDALRAGDILGTPAYMAPEQVRGEPAGPAADMYALGVVLFEMMTGQLPFQGGEPLEVARLRLSQDAPSPRTLVPDLDVRWEQAIRRCLQREPEARPQEASDVMRILELGLEAEPAVRHSLPAERDAFVGRKRALAELSERLAAGARLVTILGAGGSGKSRLAIHHGWRARAAFTGGVWFCDLSEARSVDGLLSAVAAGLSVPLAKLDGVVQLGHAMAGRGRALFIFDNFEQLVRHAPETLGRWLDRATEARFIVTSRERLALPGESTQPLEPLDGDEGLALFVARARASRPGLRVEARETERIRELVRLVDGLPLAIELAAARMRLLGVPQIIEGLRDRFALLRGGQPQGRHATLRASIEASWELLQAWEKAAFAQLGVFEGGFTLGAAEEVLDLAAWPKAPPALDVIGALVDKSLVQACLQEGANEARFTLYVSLKEYALDRLAEADAVPDRGSGREALARAQERHGAFFARFGSEASIAALAASGGSERRRTVGLELENLLEASRRAMARGDAELAAAAYQGAWSTLEMRGPLTLGLELGRRVLALPDLAPSTRARVCLSVGTAALPVGLVDEAREHYERALSLYRELADRRGESLVFRKLGTLHSDQGRALEAQEHYERALAIYVELGDLPAESTLRCNLGVVHARQGRPGEALGYYQRALAIARDSGSRRDEAIILLNLGGLHGQQGRQAESLAHLEQALVMFREAGDRRTEGVALMGLSAVHSDQGRLEESRACLERALVINREAGDRRLEGIGLGLLGGALFELGRTEEAEAHYQQALGIHREVGERRYEGLVLVALGRLQLRADRLEEARVALASGERLLRETRWQHELGRLCCTRGELELKTRDSAAARASLAEAESIAAALGAGPESGLGHAITGLRQAIATSSART